MTELTGRRRILWKILPAVVCLTMLSLPLLGQQADIESSKTASQEKEETRVSPIQALPSFRLNPAGKKRDWEKSFYQASLLSLAALNLADYLTTQEALKFPGVREANPVLQPFAKNRLAFAAVKLGLTLGNHFILKKLHRQNKTLGWAVSIASNLLLSYVVAHNLKTIRAVKAGI